MKTKTLAWLRQMQGELEQGFDLRHIAVSLIFNTDVPVITVSKLLGHAKPSTTIDICRHLHPESKELAARIMDEVITPIQVQLPQSSQAQKSTPPP